MSKYKQEMKEFCERLVMEKGIIYDDAGFSMFWPETNKGGYYSHHLRAIADFMDERDSPWREQLERDMEEFNRT